jgi:hypothetical protein
MNEDAVDYTSGPYQQFTEEPRKQELDIIDEKEEPVQEQKNAFTTKRGSKRGGKTKRTFGKTKRTFGKTKRTFGKTKRGSKKGGKTKRTTK